LDLDNIKPSITERILLEFLIDKTMGEIKVTVIDREGVAHILDAPTDMNMNIMELCKAYDLPVLGECGGMAMCATCQCYLESDTSLPEQSDAELDMLDQAFFVKSNSRLGCQIHLTDEIDGIVVRLAPEA
jgi:ferredoxin